MNKKLIGAIIAVVIVLVGGYYYASPYLVLNSIKNAAQAGDSEKVSAYMDYPSVRQSFKDQMNAYMVKEIRTKMIFSESVDFIKLTRLMIKLTQLRSCC